MRGRPLHFSRPRIPPRLGCQKVAAPSDWLYRNADERMAGTASIWRVEDEQEEQGEGDEEQGDDDDEQREREDGCTRVGRRTCGDYIATKSVLHFCNNDVSSSPSSKYATFGRC